MCSRLQQESNVAAIAKPARTIFVLACQSICDPPKNGNTDPVRETRSWYNLIGEVVQSLYGLLFEQSSPSIPVAIDCTLTFLFCSVFPGIPPANFPEPECFCIGYCGFCTRFTKIRTWKPPRTNCTARGHLAILIRLPSRGIRWGLTPACTAWVVK